MPIRPFIRQGAAVILLAVMMGAPAPGRAETFPITIEHAFGATTIRAKPERVATVAWANHEVPLALGLVPVGFARANFGDDDGNGLLPWVEDRLKDLDADAPVLFDEGDGLDFEAVAASQPDIILAAYSGLSRADYDTLSKIAPVVAYREAPWATDWRDMIRLNAVGLGLRQEGEALVAELEAQIAEATTKHPEIASKTAMFVTHLDARDLSVIRFYSDNDTRVKFLSDLGLASPEAVREASEPGRYAGEMSAEKIDAFDDVDIIITYGGAALRDRMSTNPLTAHLGTVENDAIVLLGNDPIGTAANPTPLSISWVLDDYVSLLAEAARKSE